MRRSGWIAIACGVVSLGMANAERVAAVVAIQATSATVQNPGDTAQICVVLSTGGAQIAGTQNDLVWDGSCAILSDPSDCQATGTHGKQLSGGFPPGLDFTYRALVLSFSDTNPMPDGPLYCCNFIGEADAGQCCNITVINTGAATSEQKPKTPTGEIPAMGNTAQLCTAASSGQTAHSFGDGNMGQPVSGGNDAAANAGGSGAAAPAAQPASGSGAAAAPAAQVLQGSGGGAHAENPAAAALAANPGAATPGAAPGEGQAQLPGQPEVPGQAQVAGQAPAGVPPAAAQPAAGAPAPAIATGVPTNAAATGVPTKAVPSSPPPGTPTAAAAAAAATGAAPAATKAVATKAPAAQDPPAASSGGVLAGCEISDIATSMPLLGLGALAFLARTVVRRRR